MKKLLKIISFSLCLIIASECTLDVLAPKGGSGIYDLKEYYALEDNTVDVLMLGSSLSFINIDPAILWMEDGIAAYSLGGAVQPLWNTYYYLKEALKTQKPKLITLEIYSSQLESQQDSTYNLNNIVAIKSPVNRLGAVSCSVSKQDRLSFFLGFPNYHRRYASLTREDFIKYRGRKEFEYYLGHGTYYKTKECTKPDVFINTEAKPLPSNSEKYLRKIIELCKENNIDILLFASPTALYEDFKPYYLTVENLATEYNIDYKDFNYDYDKMNIDFSSDYADENHLNQNGCPKFSKEFSRYISENYILDNHKGNAAYKRWEQAGQFYENSIMDYELSRCQSFKEHIKLVMNNSDFTDIVWIKNNIDIDIDDGNFMKLFENCNTEFVYIRNNGNEYTTIDLSAPYVFDFGYDIYSVHENKMQLNNYDLFCTDESVCSATFDTYTMKLVDVSIYDKTGKIVDKPVWINLSWVGNGD